MTGMPTNFRELLMDRLCGELHAANGRAQRDGGLYYTGSLSDEEWGKIADAAIDFAAKYIKARVPTEGTGIGQRDAGYVRGLNEQRDKILALLTPEALANQPKP